MYAFSGKFAEAVFLHQRPTSNGKSFRCCMELTDTRAGQKDGLPKWGLAKMRVGHTEFD